MGRRLNVSTPTVINTELVPLDESFYLDVDGQMEQWYYDNTQQYAPNRKITPLTLTPTLSAYDKDTQMSYNPSFYYVSWYENAYRADYIEKHYYALSNYNTAGSGLYPSDITSWNESLTALVPHSNPQQPQSKPYIWVKKYKSVGGVTTETYSLFEDDEYSIYIRGYAFAERPSSPEEGDIVLNIGNEDYDFEVYEGGQWVQEEANDGDAFFDARDYTLYVKYDQSPFWKTKEYNINENGGYVETEITNTVDSNSADYVIQGNNLLVKKNVSYSHAVSIRCAATYIDPRDSGVTYAVEDSVNLTTNRTADVVFPEVDIISPSGRAYNPLVDDENSQYDFKGVTTNNPVQPLNTDVRRYGVDVDGTEEILNSGEAVAPIMNIRYGNNPTSENQEFMYRQTAGGTLVGESIDKAFIERIKGNTVAWNELVRNGNFESVQRWSVGSQFDGTMSVANNTATLTLTGSKKTAQMIQYTTVVAGHKYYFASSIKPSVQTNISHFVAGVGVNKGNIPADVWTRLSSVATASTSTNAGEFNGGAGNLSAIGDTISYKYIIAVDLTLVYGAGNEPATVAQFEADYIKWFGKPLSYEEYDKGSLRPVLMQAVKTTGFNQWDEEWEVGDISSTTGENVPNSTCVRSKNYIGVIQNSTVYFKLPNSGTHLYFYNQERGFLSHVLHTANTTFIVPNNAAYMRFIPYTNYGTTYNHDICINISNPSKNGTYEPYGEKVQGFDVTAIKGKLNGAGESATIFPDGLKKAGNVQDEIFVEGGVVKAVKRVGSRAYESGDESDTSVITDGSTTTFYALTTPQTYVLDPITDFVWYGIKNGQEVLADTLPWYVSGQGTDNLVVDAMYGENINVVLRCKLMDGETLSPSKAYATLSWRMPDIETFVQSDNGGAVRSDTEGMTFDTIVNVNGDVLSDALKQKHLAFNWKIRKNNTSTETDKGWGQRITIDASDLRNVKGSGSTLASTLVGNEVYLLGAYEEVTDDNEVVTDDGQTVFDRPVN